MSDFTEVSSQGWLSRLGGAITGVLFGIVMVPASMGLLFWNEGRAVKTYKTLKEGAGAVVSVAADAPQAGNEGKLVHLSGMAATTETLTDDQFGVSATAIALTRDVEMYQWQEKTESKSRKKVGGGTETTKSYSYQKEWSSSLISSDGFKQKDGHQNPSSMPYQGSRQQAKVVTVGGFNLSEGLVGRIGGAKPLAVSQVPSSLAGKGKLHEGGFYIGANPASPAVGDIRIKFQVIEPDTVSVVAKQMGSNLVAYTASTGGSISMLKNGTHAADAMFEAAQKANTMLTWGLRVVGFIVMFIGFTIIFKPLSVLADVIPFIGTIVGAGAAFLSFGLAGGISLVTIAISWIFFRPLLGILLVLFSMVFFALVIGLLIKGWKMRQAAAAAA